jgi:hypothetical protein
MTAGPIRSGSRSRSKRCKLSRRGDCSSERHGATPTGKGDIRSAQGARRKVVQGQTRNRLDVGHHHSNSRRVLRIRDRDGSICWESENGGGRNAFCGRPWSRRGRLASDCHAWRSNAPCSHDPAHRSLRIRTTAVDRDSDLTRTKGVLAPRRSGPLKPCYSPLSIP